MQVDLNSATQTELEQLPAMTPVWAERIVRFRPYRRKTELLERGVVTPQIYRQIREWVHAHRVAQPAGQ